MVDQRQLTYQDGLRDGEMISIKADVGALTKDVKLLNRAVFLLYGAIALLQFVIPMIERLAKMPH